MHFHRMCLGLILVGLTVHSSGCLLVAAGAGAAGTVAYMRGDLETDEPYPLEVVYAATRETTKQLQLSVLEGKTEKDALSATIVARDASDKRVTICLKAQTERTTRLSVRIGTFGDQTKSHMIYNRIRENLKAASPPTAPPAAKPPEPSVPPQPAPAANPPASSPPVPALPPASGAPPSAPTSQEPAVAPTPEDASPPAPR